MDLHIEWQRPVRLTAARNGHMIYTVDLAKINPVAGVYVFGRTFGQSFEALYVGKADSIRSRVKGHLNNLRLMRHLENAKAGKRVLLAGRLVPKGGHKKEKCLKVAERTFIKHFLAEGHDLVNKQGTRIRRHQLESSGRYPKRFFARMLYLEKGKGE